MNGSLTEAGRTYAQANQGESLVAKVALYGENWDWPEEHVETAISICNQRGGNDRLLADVLTSDAAELD